MCTQPDSAPSPFFLNESHLHDLYQIVVSNVAKHSAGRQRSFCHFRVKHRVRLDARERLDRRDEIVGDRRLCTRGRERATGAGVRSVGAADIYAALAAARRHVESAVGVRRVRVHAVSRTA